MTWLDTDVWWSEEISLFSCSSEAVVHVENFQIHEIHFQGQKHIKLLKQIGISWLKASDPCHDTLIW